MWGQVVLSGVIEEKTSRVVEVMASGVSSTGPAVGQAARGRWAPGSRSSWSGPSRCSSSRSSGRRHGGRGAVQAAGRSRRCCSSRSWSSSCSASSSTPRSTRRSAPPSTRAGGAEPGVPGDHAADRSASIFFPMVLAAPTARSSVVLSLLPFLSPLLMFLRIVVLTPPYWQIALSIVLAGPDDRRPGLGGGAHLPRGHPDVRQEADLPGDPALGAPLLTGGAGE